MTQRLGICVASRNCFNHVLGLAQSAAAAGKQVDIFFTGEGVHQSQLNEFNTLLRFSKVTICEVSYIGNGYQGIAVPGLGDKDFVTQAQNAEMVEECDRYIIL